MDIDHILSVCNRNDVRYLLIGGVNFLLRHKPVLTFDVDLWIEDDEANRRRCEKALIELGAAWGRTESDWGPVATRPAGWLTEQAVYCLASPHGAIDIFRFVQGLTSWSAAFATSVSGQTAAGTVYRGLSDQDMLTCQLSLPPEVRKHDRVRDLREAVAAHA